MEGTRVEEPADRRKNGEPSWARVHLAYSALAAMSVLTLGLGLWSSELALRKAHETSRSVAAINELHRNGSTLNDASLKLSASTHRLLADASVADSLKDFEAAVVAFNEASAAEHWRLSKAYGLGRGRPFTAYGWSLFDKNVTERLRALRSEARSIKSEVAGNIEAVTAVVNASDPARIARHKTLAYAAADKMVALTSSIERLLGDELAKAAMSPGDGLPPAFPFSTTLIALITIMVGLLTVYAHNVANSLQAGFSKLAASDSEARISAAQQQEINEQIASLIVSLAQKMKELSEAQEEIIRRGRMSQLGQLIATVAHEIRNPLGAVKTGVFVLERRVKAEISAAFQNIATSAGDAAVPARKPEFDTQFQRINRGIARCDAIITQLLDFTRTATAQTELKEIDPWLSDVVDDLRHQLPPAVTIDLDLAMTGQTVAFDPVRIQRAVVNLVNNASEAMVGKGDDLSKYTTKNPRIIVATRLTGRGAEISVTDNGPGIQPEDLARIREPLFTTKSFGTGIGLPAVEKILEQHNGGLDISSAPGEGACFIAWFPVQNILKEAV